MIRGLYTSTMGAENAQRRLDVAANNLANVNTNGYKKDTLTSATFSELMTQAVGEGEKSNIGNLALGTGVDDVSTYFSAGNLVKTDGPLDMAISNSNLAFFAVDVPSENGTKEMYTRDGAFTLNSMGQLTTKDGYLVKGENGPIVLNGKNISISSDGTINNDGNYVDKLLVKDFKDGKALKKFGNNLYTDDGTGETSQFTGQVTQGSIESSNVNSITEMVEVINIMRSYEANQKVLKTHDDMLQKAVNEVGRV